MQFSPPLGINDLFEGLGRFILPAMRVSVKFYGMCGGAMRVEARPLNAIAVLWHEGSITIIVFNALRLMKYRQRGMNRFP